jgi:NAD(P)-dependent dehydrogenase (short-subunit alcohol dehydrogenase family)
MSEERLAGKRAIVTGGTEGIGEAIVRAFVAEGAQVLVVARRPTLGEALVDDLGADSVRFLALDVTAVGAAEAAVVDVTEAFGGLDILVNNAAMDYTSPLVETTTEELEPLLATNFVAPLRFTQAAARAMMGAGGSIINISSRAASAGIPTLAVYGAIKGAIESLTRGAAIELVDDDIRVNAVAPGLTNTPLVRRWIDEQPDPEAFEKAAVATVPRKRLGTPAEVAAAVVYLATDLAANVTGSTIPVDGGYTAA